MGQDYKECWISAWPMLGEAFEQASLGHTRFLENQRMFLDRYGYLEETFFTFSFSPIRDETGGVGGLFHLVTELTQQTLVERRLDIVRTLADQTVNASSTEEALKLIAETLQAFELDLPFTLLYTLSHDGTKANLAGAAGIQADTALAPNVIDLDTESVYSSFFARVIQSGKFTQIEYLQKHFGSFSCRPYPEPPKTALIFPIYLPGNTCTHTIFIAGVSARRALDEKYLSFYQLLVAAATNALTKARAFEEEKNVQKRWLKLTGQRLLSSVTSAMSSAHH